MARTGRISLTVSEPILDELEEVLRRKFNFAPKDLVEALSRVREMARTVKPALSINAIKEDPADNRILECAVSAGSDFIVTGDKDLLRLKRYDGIRILTVSDFLDVEAARS